MRALIVSEGKHEQTGALQALVERLRGTTFESIEHAKVSDPKIHVFHGKGKGFLKRAVGWLIEARKREVDVLVLVIDEDGDQTRIAQFNEAQAYEQVALTARVRCGRANVRRLDAGG